MVVNATTESPFNGEWDGAPICEDTYHNYYVEIHQLKENVISQIIPIRHGLAFRSDRGRRASRSVRTSEYYALLA